MGNSNLEQNKQEKPVSFFSKVLTIGFVGGVIWSILGTIATYFNFTSVSPASFLLRSWLTEKWTERWLGSLISILLIGLLSMGVAVLYYVLLKNMESIWVSAAFGVVLWFIMFYLLQPIFKDVPKMTDLDSDTIVTTLCLYLLYGTFIGYSISYHYLDQQRGGGKDYSQ